MDLANKKVLVMGLGLFGGGVGVTRYLVSQGAHVKVTDLRSASQLQESLEQIKDLPLEFRLGEHKEEDFLHSDLIIVNPAVPTTSAYLRIAKSVGIPMDTEMDMFLRHTPSPVIAVTGSNGKSTTTAMIAHILEVAGYTTWLGGNIGHCLLEDLPKMRPDHWVVIEISSFQLERVTVSPHIAVITNIAPNHLDWHGTMENYAKAKQNILRFQKKTDYCVLNGKDKDVSQWGRLTSGQALLFGTKEGNVFIENEKIFWKDKGKIQEVMSTRDIPLPGVANQENAMAAIAVVMPQKISCDIISKALESFVGLPHRLQPLGTFQGREFYDDSNATTPESTMVALDTIKKPIILLAGGSNKGFDYRDLGKAIARSTVKILILMGKTAPDIESAVVANTPHPEIVHAQDLDDAMRQAKAKSAVGDVVLLSPASTSFGMFRNFVERGKAFQKLMRIYF